MQCSYFRFFFFFFQAEDGIRDIGVTGVQTCALPILERALPFREGEEVHVEIVEPHMYRPGDAVAKVDGYIIAVRGATAYVGQKLLVRIEQVGRVEAEASLVDAPPADPGDSDGDGLERSEERRGGE